MHRHFGKRSVLSAIVLAAAGMMPAAAQAEFALGGYTPQVVQSEKGLDGAALFFQTTRVWDVSGWDTELQDFKTVNVNFTIPPNQAVSFARLYLDVYGGNKLYTAQVAVAVNGTALPTVRIAGADSQGHSLDTNPTFDATQTCVYGSSIGQWQLALANMAGLLKTDGTANAITVAVSDPDSTGFDGRMVDVSLVAVYQDPSINQKLDYYLAEGDGYLRKPPANPTYGNAPAQRSVAFSGLDTASVTSATYTTLYTHGDSGQADRLFFNGAQLGANDVAHAQYGQYGPDLPTFVVTNNLAANLNVLYDVNTADNLAGETSLLAKIGLLAVAHPLPAGHSAWTAVAGGDWNAAGNWDNGVPQSAGDAAIFKDSIGGTPAVVELNGNRTLSSISFNSPGGSYTISPGSGGALTLANGGNPAPVTVGNSGGRHAIQVPLELQDNLAVSVGAGTGAELTISGRIAGDGTALVKTGAGLLVLSALTNDYSGGTVVSGGTLELASAGALPIGRGLTIGRSGTAVLAGGCTSDRTFGDVNAVPEPSAAALLAPLAGTCLLVWRKRRHT